MTDKIATLVQETAAAWSSIAPQNQAGVYLAGQLSGTIAGYTAERGKMAFEDEPSGFDAALLACKEA